MAGTAERSASAVIAGAEAGFGQDRGMDASRELAQLLERDLELDRRFIGRGDGFVIRPTDRTEVRPEQPEGERQRDEPLLGAIVQVAFEPTPFGVRRLHDPRS